MERANNGGAFSLLQPFAPAYMKLDLKCGRRQAAADQVGNRLPHSKAVSRFACHRTPKRKQMFVLLLREKYD